MSSKERLKKEDAIFDQIIKNLPLDNDTFYIKHDRENNTFLLKEDKDLFIKNGIIKRLEAIESKLKMKDKIKENRKKLKKLKKNILQS